MFHTLERLVVTGQFETFHSKIEILDEYRISTLKAIYYVTDFSFKHLITISTRYYRTFQHLHEYFKVTLKKKVILFSIKKTINVSLSL